MELFRYRANILPEITLCGKHVSDEPDRNIRRVSGDYIFYIVTDGDLYINEDGVAYHLQRGDCFMLEPGKLHYGTQSAVYELFYIHFRHPQIEKCVVDDQQWSQMVRRTHAAWNAALDSGPFPEEYITICKHLRVDVSSLTNMMEQMLRMKQIHMEHSNILCSCAASEVFIEFQRQYTFDLIRASGRGMQKMARVNAVIQYLTNNYRQKITSADIERELSYNFDYLNQIFRQNLHSSIFQMLENIRMEAAKQILQTQSLTIKEIANEVGYTDEAYFSKVFKRHTGVSPAQYQKNGQSA